jgi:SAM-dependent methyltransferase
VLIRYETWRGGAEAPPERFEEAVESVCREEGTRRMLEVGGGAKPMLPLSVTRQYGISEYVVTDISAEELAKAPEGYTAVVTDISSGTDELGPFDIVVSRTVAEHLTAPADFHRAVFNMLAPGGRAMHFFSTLYEPAFIANRLLPEAIAQGILQVIQPHRAREGTAGKFPAYYRWCRGPTRQQIARLTRLGFEIDEYVGVFGHEYYKRVAPLDRLEALLAERLCQHPLPYLTAYAWVTLRRPQAAAT